MKFTLAAICSLLVGASAFAPIVNTERKTSALSMSDDFFGEPDNGKKEMSKSLPFTERPKILDGSLAGDVGFDPFGFGGADMPSLINMREAEIKHCRLAMLAAVGWPLAELLDKPIADQLSLPTLLTKTGSSPSLLNGGLDRIDIEYWVAVVAIAGFIELENQKVKEEKGKNYTPGDVGFDPLGFFPKDKNGQLEMQTKELKHGRLAMMAILGFVVQEALYNMPVTQETPMFFTPMI